MTDNQREWGRAKDQLVSAIKQLGFPEELGEQIAKQLGSPKAMNRMMSYLYNVKPRNAGDIVLYSGNQIVVFYGSNSWAYTRLGHIDMTQEELTDLLGNGDVEITLE